MAFTVHAVMPGVWHIVDCMGVCMTLLEGENAAMLVDTGYGIEDVADFMRHMTDLPLTVFLTHNHHDHAMGARCFPETYMLEADMADWDMFTNDKMRRRVLTQAIGKNLTVDEKTFLAGEIPLPKVMKPGVIDLGGLTAEIIEAPGHTPGSASPAPGSDPSDGLGNGGHGTHASWQGWTVHHHHCHPRVGRGPQLRLRHGPAAVLGDDYVDPMAPE